MEGKPGLTLLKDCNRNEEEGTYTAYQIGDTIEGRCYLRFESPSKERGYYEVRNAASLSKPGFKFSMSLLEEETNREADEALKHSRNGLFNLVSGYRSALAALLRKGHREETVLVNIGGKSTGCILSQGDSDGSPYAVDVRRIYHYTMLLSLGSPTRAFEVAKAAKLTDVERGVGNAIAWNELPVIAMRVRDGEWKVGTTYETGNGRVFSSDSYIRSWLEAMVHFNKAEFTEGVAMKFIEYMRGRVPEELGRHSLVMDARRRTS